MSVPSKWQLVPHPRVAEKKPPQHIEVDEREMTYEEFQLFAKMHARKPPLPEPG